MGNPNDGFPLTGKALFFPDSNGCLLNELHIIWSLMMKLVVKMLLLCGFLFLGWYAHTSQAPGGYAANTVDRSALAEYPVVQNNKAFFTAAPLRGVKKVADPLKATKEEDDDDDDDDYFKKHPGTGCGGIPSFYSIIIGRFSNYHTGRLPVCEHFSYVSTSRFIMHCVIRI